METLAPPPTDPLVRSEPPFVWGHTPTAPLRSPLPNDKDPAEALDPDISLWRAIIVNIWPFTGPPATGEWPTGWLGVDAGGTPYVCTSGGTPGMWSQVGSGGGGGIGQLLSLTYNGTTGNVPVYGLPTGWSGSGIAAMGAELTTASGPIASGVLLDSNGEALPDGWSFPAMLFVEDSVIYDIIAVNPLFFGNAGGFLAWGQSGGSANQLQITNSTGITLRTNSGDTGGIAITDDGSGGIQLIATTGGMGIYVNADGAQELVISQENTGNTGGVHIGDSGTGGVALATEGSDISITIPSGTGGVSVVAAGAGGLSLTESGGGGIAIDETGDGAAINIETTGGQATTGITLTTQASDTGGVTLTDNGDNGVNLVSNGAGGIAIDNFGATATSLTQGGTGPIEITAGTTAGGIQIATEGTAGITLTDETVGGITLDNAGSGNIILTGLPTSDPGVPGALYTTAGALMVSA